MTISDVSPGEVIPAIVQPGSDTAANWTLYNPVLLDGERVRETSTIEGGAPRYKTGDGVTPYSELPYDFDWSGSVAGQVPISTGSGFIWRSPAVLFTGTPQPDSTSGMPGTTGQASDAGHSHPLSSLVQLKGITATNVVSASGSSVTLPIPTSYAANYVTLTASQVFIHFPPAVEGEAFSLAIKQDSTGSRVPVFDSNVGFPGGTAPAWSTSPGLVDVAYFFCFDGVNWNCLFPPALSQIPPPTPIGIVQYAQGTTSATTLPANVTPGNTLIMLVLGGYNYTPSAPSGGGVTWTEINPSTWVRGDGNREDTFDPTYSQISVSVYYGIDSSGGSGSSNFTFSNGNSNNSQVFVVELSGVAQSSAFDGNVVVSQITTSGAGSASFSGISASTIGDALVMIGVNSSLTSFDGTSFPNSSLVTTTNGWKLLPVGADGTYDAVFAINTTPTVGASYAPVFTTTAHVNFPVMAFALKNIA